MKKAYTFGGISNITFNQILIIMHDNDVARSANWIHTPNRNFGGVRPVVLLQIPERRIKVVRWIKTALAGYSP